MLSLTIRLEAPAMVLGPLLATLLDHAQALGFAPTEVDLASPAFAAFLGLILVLLLMLVERRNRDRRW